MENVIRTYQFHGQLNKILFRATDCLQFMHIGLLVNESLSSPHVNTVTSTNTRWRLKPAPIRIFVPI